MKPEILKSHGVKIKEHFAKELLGVRVGRATTSLVEDIRVAAYSGTDPMPLIEVASVSVPDPQSILITPWDRSILKKIEEAVRESGKNLNPVNDGIAIRVPVPALTEDTRKDVAKDISKMLEESKITVRNLRQDAMKSLEEQEDEGVISEDDMYREKKNVETAIGEINRELEDMAEKKKLEVLKI